MPPTIEIDDGLLEFLKDRAEPFVDTPSSVLRRLLGLDPTGNGSVGGEHGAALTPIKKPRRSGRSRKPKLPSSRAKRGSLLPESEFEIPILRYLAKHGGRAPSQEVTEGVGEELSDRLTPVDREKTGSGIVRWENRVAFTRLRLVERGDLDGDAPRGTWQITDQGRKRLAAAS